LRKIKIQNLHNKPGANKTQTIYISLTKTAPTQ